jgi:REP element-mobilizing transposase RayT
VPDPSLSKSFTLTCDLDFRSWAQPSPACTITSSSRPKSDDLSLSPNGSHVFILTSAGSSGRCTVWPRLSGELRIMSISWASLRPVHCIADVLRDLKKESSTWAKENFNRRFTWQEGYAAFTVSPMVTDSVRRYIATQEAHHRKYFFILY